jgi:twitching motility protein PilT
MAQTNKRFKLDAEVLAKGMDLLKDMVKYLVAKEGSDLHIRTNRVPFARIHGRLVSDFGSETIRAETVEALIATMVKLRGGSQDPDLSAFSEFLSQNLAVNFSCSTAEAGDEDMPIVRLRINVFHDSSGLAFVARVLADTIRPLEELGFEEDVCDALKRCIMLPSGLVLVTGPTGSGKTTTLAALINYINMNRQCHIITIEDPVEILFPQFYPAVPESEKYKSLITQREVYVDTPSFKTGLEDSLREDPDVILVGEIRSLETMESALAAAETGHLVFATLHTNGGYQTIGRIKSEFPASRHNFVIHQLAANLRCVVSQTLLPAADGKGRVLGYEYLENIDQVKAAIAQDKIESIPGQMKTPCIQWNTRLKTLLDENKIDEETHKRHLSKDQNE